jgi:hypothetical protein
MEIKDASDAKVAQQFTSDQRLSTGETKTFTYSWTPSKPGIYKVDAGVFGDNWATKHIFNKGAATITVSDDFRLQHLIEPSRND